MKLSKTLLVIIFLISGPLLFGQQPKNQWEKWNFLIGEWVGEGNGQPGQGEGKFSLQPDLDGNILVRKNSSAYPETPTSKAFVHEDLLIVYPGSGDSPQEAIYFDNEGHTIRYKVTFAGNSIILTSDIVANTPRFRLSYVMIDSRKVKIDFEMASPQNPEEFKMYLSGKAIKVK
jgi:hypothetical protein